MTGRCHVVFLAALLLATIPLTPCFSGSRDVQYDIDKLAQMSRKRIDEINNILKKGNKNAENRKLNRMFESAEKLYKEGRYSEAIEAFKEIKRERDKRN